MPLSFLERDQALDRAAFLFERYQALISLRPDTENRRPSRKRTLQ